MDPRLRGDDDFFPWCHSVPRHGIQVIKKGRTKGATSVLTWIPTFVGMTIKKTWNESSTLIIIPILNGEIASSLPSTANDRGAKFSVVANAVTAALSTSCCTIGSRAVRVAEHPSRTNGICHSRPAINTGCFLGKPVIISWVCRIVCTTC